MAACQPTILFLPPLDRSLRSAWECSQGRSAFRWGGWIKIKSCRRATARPVEWLRAKRGRRSIVGAGLSGRRIAAMTACQPTNLFLLRRDRSLRSAWECSQGRSAFRSGGWMKIKSCRRATARPVEWLRARRVCRSIVGAGLSGRRIAAMTACQPTNLLQVYKIQLWERAFSGRRSDDGVLAGAPIFADVPDSPDSL